MITKKLIVAGFMTFACVTTALADGVGTFPEKGKTYLIHRFNKSIPPKGLRPRATTTFAVPTKQSILQKTVP